MNDYPRRGDIYWISLDPTVASEIQKTRPCIILSNDSQNKKGLRVIAAPLTSKIKIVFPFESKIVVKNRECKVLLDQIRSLDKLRISKKISSVSSKELLEIEDALKIALFLNKIHNS